LRANAKRARITLPERLTIALGEPGFAEWQRHIADYRRAAGVRLAKTKLAPASLAALG
jgi:hypothetical protein